MGTRSAAIVAMSEPEHQAHYNKGPLSTRPRSCSFASTSSGQEHELPWFLQNNSVKKII
jgi:hypothetical protein